MGEGEDDTIDQKYCGFARENQALEWLSEGIDLVFDTGFDVCETMTADQQGLNVCDNRKMIQGARDAATLVGYRIQIKAGLLVGCDR